MTTGIGGPRPLNPLPQARDASIDASTLAPWISQYAEKYGVDPQIVGAVIAQESSFINHGVHRDGHGHGLVGLDDNGLLPDFERWSGTRVGRGRHANTIAPEKQIEFLAKTLGDYTEKCGGDQWEAVRAWHAGFGGRNNNNGKEYERLVRGRFPEIVDAIPPATGGAIPPELETTAPMLASNFTPAVRAPVKLTAPEGTTPIGRKVDYENG
ncbi:MAG: transglycosylase SLT domain-containing protein [Myxococcaceae bacterium]